MDNSCLSSGISTITTNSSSSISSNNNNNRDQYLKQINKLSHKISKTSAVTATNNPVLKKAPAFEHQNQPPQRNLQPPQQQHQPPVYNINKNDFRDVVQKLTGSPVHERFSTLQPIHQPKPPNSRLQCIRPPPLAHVSNRPLSALSCAAPPIPPLNTTINNSFIQRPTAPLSPLPPLPAVHAAAESPVSAYMRYLQNWMSAADSNSKPQLSGFSPLAPLVSQRWNNSTDTSQPQGVVPRPTSQQQMQPQPQLQFPFPSSPLPFGCLNSPRSPYPLLSPSLLFSPTSGKFPLSPTVLVPSPSWRNL